jgi:septal ring factor EnvC (AmiA/AmiB activator)
MKRFSLILTVLVVTMVAPVRAQDVASLEERVKRLNGYVQDLQEANANQKKQIEGLERDLAALREQLQNQPKTAAVSPDDLRELARKIQDVDEKRKSDNELIAREIKALAKVAAGSPSGRSTQSPRANANRSGPLPADLPKEALEHTVVEGEFLSTIAAAYSKEKGVKITTALILKANPTLKPERMQVGQKILIPIPEK